MYTVRDMIGRALRLVGAVDPGEAPQTEEENDALQTLNDLLDAWRIERLLLPYTASAVYETAPGQNSYSLGTGGDWDGPRPSAQLRYATFRFGGIDYPLTLLTHQQYIDIEVKSFATEIPDGMYYEAQYPLARCVLYPTPSAVAQVILSYDSIFSSVTLDSNAEELPPGYRRALVYNLALDLKPEYPGKEMSADVREIARTSKAAIMSANSVSLDAPMDPRLPGAGGRYNIYAGG